MNNKLYFSDKNKLTFQLQDKNNLVLLSKKFKYKRLKRFIYSTIETKIIFYDKLNINKIKKICDTLTSIYPDIEIESNVFEYIGQREYFIQSHARVGNDVKKRNPKIIGEYNEFKKSVDSLMDRKLVDEQMWSAFYMYSMKMSSNFSVPGSGKTATVLGMYAFMKNNEEIERIVMIGPKNSFGSWIDEFKICFNRKEDNFYLNIHDDRLNDTKKRKYALKFETASKELILLNYEAIESISSEVAGLIDKKTLLVFDEVHRIKNPYGQRANVAKDVSIGAGSIVTLTGTPIPNSYQDIYNNLNILYPEDYEDFFGFTISELKNADQFGIEKINKKINPFFCRISKDALGVPPANNDIIENVKVSDYENQLYKIIFQTYHSNLFSLLIRVLQLESNPRLLLKGIDEMDYGSIIDDESDYSKDVEIVNYSQSVKELVDKIEISSKAKLTINLVKRLVSEGKPVIIWCIFVASIKMLEGHFIEMGLKVRCIYGEVPVSERIQLLEDYKNGDFDILITNPHTLAESISLHKVCHDAIYFEYSFNLVHLLQSKDRIHRLGLPEKQYTQYYFMQNEYVYNDQKTSLDERIYKRLTEKEKTMLEAIDNDVLGNMTSVNDDLELVFKNMFK